uniref:Putative group i salivary lipocalin n=1 Tax=Rhipicephalus pulchellus TaxID=72859 RepID=L7LTG7_RHIPC
MFSRKEASQASPVVFAFLLLLPTALPLGPYRRQMRGQRLNVKKFYNTSEPIWTFYSTEHSKIECKVDMMLDMNETYVKFETAFSARGGARINVTNLGKFEKWKTQKEFHRGCFNAMILSNPGREPYGFEKLLFQTLDNNCGVFLLGVNNLPYQWYEMRVKNSTVRRPHWACVMNFASATYRKAKEREVYWPKCQRMFNGKAEGGKGRWEE